MKKVITASIVAALVIGSSATGQIQQGQNWHFELGPTLMGLSGGPGDATATQGVGTLSIQNLGINPDVNGNPTAAASQGVGLALFQTGYANTGGAAIDLVQDLNIEGAPIVLNPGTPDEVTLVGQTQVVGDLGNPTLQYQGVSVGGTELMEKSTIGSTANANGLQLVAFGMGQEMYNGCANGIQLSLILGGEYTEINGGAQSTGLVMTGMTGTVQQVQTANQ